MFFAIEDNKVTASSTVRQRGFGWVLDDGENTIINDYKLTLAKDRRKQALETAYEASKKNIHITFQGFSYERAKNYDDAVLLCLSWAKEGSIEPVDGLGLTRGQCSIIMDKMVTYRVDIANNLDTAKAEIDGLSSVEDVESYTTELQVIVPHELEVTTL